VLEFSPKQKQGFMGAAIWAMVISGIVLASGVATLFHSIFQSEFLHTWGWRIGFWLSGLLGVIVYFLRRNMQETPDFVEVQQQGHQRLLPIFIKHWRVMLISIFVLALPACYFYTVFIYMVGLFKHHYHVAANVALEFNTISLIVMVLALFFFGWVSNRCNKSIMAFISGCILLVYTIIVFHVLSLPHVADRLLLFIQVGFTFLIAANLSSIPAILVNLAPSNIRYSMVSVSYNVCFAIFGGFAPLIASEVLMKTGHIMDVSFFLIFSCLCSLAAYLCSFRRLAK
jgi:MFS transporter, MHS family, proline/betaine transporter